MEFPTKGQKNYRHVPWSVVSIFYVLKLTDIILKKKCYCYKCRLARLLTNLLRNRGHLPLIYVMANNNYLRCHRHIVEFFNKIKKYLD